MAKPKRLKPIGDYLYDKGEMIEQMFSSIPIVEIRNMVPIKLQGMPLHELKAECLVELLGMSDREIIHVVNGKKERNLTSSESENEDMFVISDDERRIKKEKKETVRRIKTERTSSKKDAKRKSPEPSVSKKKRKSKEEVDVKSKKKKKKSDKSNPSSSRELVKVPGAKMKKDEKKKDASKAKDEDDVVVLDDDSDKEEKREQKSLLDLLELEMRARAIRSLLKKEDHTQSQKILSEYKDEPDDLIPIEIEPPQIELLSDSEEEVEVDSNVGGKKGDENSNGGVSSKTPDLCDADDLETSSRSPQTSLNDDSNSVSCNVVETEAVKTTIEKQISPERSSEMLEGTDTIVDSCDKPSEEATTVTGEQMDETVIGVTQLSPTKDGEPNTTGHFLVCEESSVANAMDGSQMEKNDRPTCLEDNKTVSEGEHGASTEVGEHLSEPVVESCEVNIRSETSNCHHSSETAEANLSASVAEGDENSRTLSLGHSATLATPLQSVGVENSIEGTSDFQVEDEALDYEDDDALYQSPKTPHLTAGIKGLPIKVDGPVLPDRIGNVSDSNNVDNLHFASKLKSPDPDSTVTSPEIISSYSDLAQPPPVTLHDNNAMSVIEELDNVPKDVSPKDIVQNCDGSRMEVLMEREPIIASASSADNDDELESRHEICTDEGANTTNSDPALCDLHDSESVNHNIACAGYTGDLTSIVGEEKMVQDLESLEQPASQPLATSTAIGVQDSIHPPLEGEVSLETYPDELVVESTSVNVDETETCQSNECDVVVLTGPVHPMLPANGQLLAVNACKRGTLLESCKNCSSGGVTVDHKSTKVLENSLACKSDVIAFTEHHELIVESTSVDVGETEPCQSSLSSDGVVTSIPVDPISTPVSLANDQFLAIEPSDEKKKEPMDSPIDEAAVSDFESTKNSEHLVTYKPEETSEVGTTFISAGETESCHSSSASGVVSCDSVDNFPHDRVLATEALSEKDELLESCVVRLNQPTKGEVALTETTSNLENSFTPNNGPVLERKNHDQTDEALVETCHVSSQLLNPPIPAVVEIIDEASEPIMCQTSERECLPQGCNIAEIIDITEGDLDPDVVCIRDERFDSESIDGSDNEMEGKAAMILEQMNDILNGAVDNTCGSECSQSASSGTSQVPADILSVVDSENSDSETEEEAEDEESEQSERSDENVVEILDDIQEVISQSDVTPNSNYDTVELIEDSINIADSSSSSDESNQDDSDSDSVMFVESINSQSDPDDCAVVTQQTGTAEKSSPNPDISVVEASLIPPKIVSTPGSVAVTIVIEDDDGEEEVKLLTEEVPAEIFELEDDDEAKTNWTARWLESDNVKKVVKTSKIWTNVRKQMKLKLKKPEVPVVTNVPKPSEDRVPPPLIGSVEEYHRLVKEGVICSRATQNEQPTNSDATEKKNTPELSTSCKNNDSPSSICSEVTAAAHGGTKPEESPRRKSEKKRKSDKKKKSDKSEKRKKHKKDSKKKTEDFSEISRSSKVSSSTNTESINPHEVNESLFNNKALDESLEDGEIVEPADNTAESVEKGKRVEPKGGKSSCVRENIDANCGEREVGEASEREEGEISSDGEIVETESPDVSSEESKSCSNAKEMNRTDSPLSSIPLPCKPPVKPKPTKNPDRNSAAKRFILRNLQLGKKRPVTTKTKKKRKKGGGNSSNAPKKNPLPPPVPFVASLNQVGSIGIPDASIVQAYQATHSGLAQPHIPVAPAQNTVPNNTEYDSYYSWAYSQGLTNMSSGNYGYGTGSTADPNIYKQWEEYYRKLMEACKISAAHASGTMTGLTEQEKSGYTWVFDHSVTSSQTAPVHTGQSSTEQCGTVQAPADSTADPGVQIQPANPQPEAPPPANEITNQDRFESWQFRYGLNGLLKEHFVPAPSTADKKT